VTREIKPLIHFEQLEPRILLSGDHLLYIAPDPDQDHILSNPSTFIQEAELLHIQVEEQINQELAPPDQPNIDPCRPIITLFVDDDDNTEDSDSGEKSQAQYDLEQSIALLVTADYKEINAGEIIWTDVNDELEGTDNCELQSIVEQLTETLRVPHGPPNNNEMPTSQNDSSSSNQLVQVDAGTQFDLTIRVQMQDSSVIEIFDNSRGIVLAGFALEGIDNVLVVGGDESNDTLTIDLSTPFSVPGGIQYVGGEGGYDKLVMFGCPELSVDYVDSGTDAGIITVTDEAGQTTTVAFSGLEPFVYLNHFGEINNSGFFNYGNSPEILNVTNYTQASDATLEIEIGGYSPGPGTPTDNGFDQINVTEEATLDGTLSVSLINDFIPVLDDTFDFLTFGTISGSFSQVTGPFDFGDSGLYFEVVEQSDRLQLVVAEIPTEQDLHITTSATNRMEAAIEGLADHADTLLSDLLLANPDITGQTLPGTNVSLDELFNLTDYLDIGPALDDYVTPMQELGSDLRFEIDEFLNYLRGSWLDDLLGGQAHDIDFTSKTYTGEYDWIDGITVEFSGVASYDKAIPVGLSETVEGIGPAFAEVEVTIDAAFGFTLGLRWPDGTGDYEFGLRVRGNSA